MPPVNIYFFTMKGETRAGTNPVQLQGVTFDQEASHSLRARGLL